MRISITIGLATQLPATVHMSRDPVRSSPTALAWIDPDASIEYTSEIVQIRQLARRLGYRLIWPDASSILPVAEQMRSADTDALITPAPHHLDPLTLHTLMGLGDVETVWPRLSFARWSVVGNRG